MNRYALKPLSMGAAMGLMMLWMLHMQLIGDSTRSLGALMIFLGAHVAILAVVLTPPFIASPRLRRVLERRPRPSLRHFALMLAGGAFAAGLTHFIVHAGVS